MAKTSFRKSAISQICRFPGNWESSELAKLDDAELAWILKDLEKQYRVTCAPR